MSLQQVAATKLLCAGRKKLGPSFLRPGSVCTGRAISCCNKLRVTSQERQVASCVLATEFFRYNKSHKFSLIWFCATWFCCGDKDFQKNFPRTHKATCSRDLSPQRVAATCRLVCSDLNTFAAFHSSEHTQWNEVEAWADSFIQISEFCHPQASYLCSQEWGMSLFCILLQMKISSPTRYLNSASLAFSCILRYEDHVT